MLFTSNPNSLSERRALIRALIYMRVRAKREQSEREILPVLEPQSVSERGEGADRVQQKTISSITQIFFFGGFFDPFFSFSFLYLTTNISLPTRFSLKIYIYQCSYERIKAVLGWTDFFETFYIPKFVWILLIIKNTTIK